MSTDYNPILREKAPLIEAIHANRCRLRPEDKALEQEWYVKITTDLLDLGNMVEGKRKLSIRASGKLGAILGRMNGYIRHLSYVIDS